VARKQQAATQTEELASRIRDRIIEFRRVPAAELQDNQRNWRIHPYAQRLALSESLERVGIADALIAYYSERNGGRLTLIDGHLRREEHDDLDWPVLVTDLTDSEADLLLATLDPIAGMAEVAEEPLTDLLEDLSTGTPALEDLLRSLRPEASAEDELAAEEGGPPEMELQAFEHYDYLIFLFDNALDWEQAKDRFGIQHEAFTLRDGKTRKVGLGRVLPGKRLLRLFEQLEQQQ
jgi:hypothetical protein